MIFLRLLKTDLDSIRFWFLKNTFAKIIVLGLFGLIIGVTSCLTYIFSRAYFSNMKLYEAYGDFVTFYSLHAAVLTLIWFATVSSYMFYQTLVLKRDLKWQFLLTQPIGRNQIAFWVFIKAFIVNSFWTGIFLFPIILGKFDGISVYAIGVAAIVLLTILFISQGIAMMACYLWLVLFSRQRYLGYVCTFLVIFTISVLLERVIFSKALINLYNLGPNEFFEYANKLPLMKAKYFSVWLVELLLGNYQNLIPLIISVTTTFLFGYMIHATFFVSWKRKIWTGSLGSSLKPLIFVTPSTIIRKDILRLVRSRVVLVNALFLISMSFLMFFTLIEASNFRPLSRLEERDLVRLTYGWLVFFGINYLLRFVFPLVSEEGHLLWLFTTTGVKRSRVLIAKLFSSLIITTPLFLGAIALWGISPFSEKYFLTGYTLVSLLVLTVVTYLFGAILPDYENAKQPEKTSTSLGGLIALIVGLVWVGVTTAYLR